MSKLNYLLYSFLFLLCVQCQEKTNESTIDEPKDTISNITFETIEMDEDLFGYDSPPALYLMVKYKKPKNEIKLEDNPLDNEFSKRFDKDGIGRFVEMIDTVIIHEVEHLITKDTATYNKIKRGEESYSGRVEKYGLGLSYKIYLDEVSKEVVFDYDMQFHVRRAIKSVRLAGMEDVKKIREVLIKKKQEMEVYE